MLLVKTKTGPSQIAGIGLFSDQFIPKGTKVWTYEPKLDLLLTQEDITQLSAPAQEQFYNYAFLDEKYGKWMLCGDDGRFFNHSEAPNCDDSHEDATFALKDIDPGEELTVNYKKFYGDIEDHPEIK